MMHPQIIAICRCHNFSSSKLGSLYFLLQCFIQSYISESYSQKHSQETSCSISQMKENNQRTMIPDKNKSASGLTLHLIAYWWIKTIKSKLESTSRMLVISKERTLQIVNQVDVPTRNTIIIGNDKLNDNHYLGNICFGVTSSTIFWRHVLHQNSITASTA